MPKYFIYARKSSEAEDRQVLSVESQTRELRNLAEKLNLPVEEVLTESKSAKEPGRPVFNALMNRIYKGEAQGIICWKLDRLARNPVDGGSIIWAIKQHGVRIVTPTQNYSHEEDNTILMYIEFGMAQKYIDDLSRNVRRGLKTKLEKGWYPSVAPLGYLNNPAKSKGDKDIIPDPERFDLIRKMWDLMLTGNCPPARIVEIANKEWGFRTRTMRKLGGKPLNRSGIYKIFNKPFYYGYFEYPEGSGLWYRGSHKPMVTEKEYDRVQELLGRKGKTRMKKLEFPFTGMIRCGECGAMVTAEEKHQLICPDCRFKFAYRNRDGCPKCGLSIEKMTSPTRLCYVYYHCTKMKHPSCTQRFIRAEDMEGQIDDYLSRIEMPERFKDWAIRQLKKTHEDDIKERETVVQSRKTAYQNCLKRIDNLLALKTSPLNADGSLLSDQEYSKQRMNLLKEKTRLEAAVSENGNADRSLELSEKTFEFACYARKWFKKGDAKAKKGILAAIASNLTLKDKKLNISAHKPFFILEKSLPAITLPLRPFEPENNGLGKRKTEALTSACLSGRRGSNNVRTCKFPSLPQRNTLAQLTNKVWEFFKEASSYPDIPDFRKRHDTSPDVAVS